jgi:hypothetical protein
MRWRKLGQEEWQNDWTTLDTVTKARYHTTKQVKAGRELCYRLKSLQEGVDEWTKRLCVPFPDVRRPQ